MIRQKSADVSVFQVSSTLVGLNVFVAYVDVIICSFGCNVQCSFLAVVNLIQSIDGLLTPCFCKITQLAILSFLKFEFVVAEYITHES